jgi:thiopeptide-type bacteriocin biosynthesis protein
MRLDDHDQLRGLRRELGRNPLLRLQEPRNGDAVQNWLVGPDGRHSNEIVVPMVRRAGGESGTDRAEAGAGSQPSHIQPAKPRIHLPGGEWLFAKIYVPVAAQQEVLGKRLRPLVAEAERLRAGTWFYIRYADPRAHLRLRFHGDREALWQHLLPIVHSWVEDLRSVGLAGAVELSTYEPETERYGGPEVLDAAERAFTGDSRTAIELLAAATTGPPMLAVVTAASVIDLLQAFGGRSALAEWQTAGGPEGSRLPARYTREDLKATAAFAFDAASSPAQSVGATLTAAWDLRRSAVRDYGRRVAELDATGTGRKRAADIGASLVHMHCNRMLGVDRAREADVLALARAAVRDRLGRERHGGRLAAGAAGTAGDHHVRAD